MRQGSVLEHIAPTSFVLGNSIITDDSQYKNWLFYRAGMTSDEMTLLNTKLLQSSLELYAPLDGQKIKYNNELINLAQSTNTLSYVPTNGIQVFSATVSPKGQLK